jgi:hypothetical protein
MFEIKDFFKFNGKPDGLKKFGLLEMARSTIR